MGGQPSRERGGLKIDSYRLAYQVQNKKRERGLGGVSAVFTGGMNLSTQAPSFSVGSIYSSGGHRSASQLHSAALQDHVHLGRLDRSTAASLESWHRSHSLTDLSFLRLSGKRLNYLNCAPRRSLFVLLKLHFWFKMSFFFPLQQSCCSCCSWCSEYEPKSRAAKTHRGLFIHKIHSVLFHVWNWSAHK